MTELHSITQEYRGMVQTRELELFPNGMKPFLLPRTKISTPIKPPATYTMGKRAEAYFHSAIAHSDRYDMLASQIQLIKEGRTLGELDFIFEDLQNGTQYHVEFAYKLYLYHPENNTDLGHWLGPNRRDSLDKKLEKLYRYQFKNLYSETAKRTLEELGINTQSLHQRLCLKAQLFVPWAFSGTLAADKQYCQSGKWLYYADFIRANWSGYQFFLPEKYLWLIVPHIGCRYLTFNEIKPLVYHKISNQRSPLLWYKTPEGKLEKLFVVFW